MVGNVSGSCGSHYRRVPTFATHVMETASVTSLLFHVSGFEFQVVRKLGTGSCPWNIEPDTRNSGSKGERRATEPVAAAEAAIAEEGFMSSGGLDSQSSNDSVASVACGA